MSIRVANRNDSGVLVFLKTEIPFVIHNGNILLAITIKVPEVSPSGPCQRYEVCRRGKTDYTGSAAGVARNRQGIAGSVGKNHVRLSIAIDIDQVRSVGTGSCGKSTFAAKEQASSVPPRISDQKGTADLETTPPTVSEMGL